MSESTSRDLRRYSGSGITARLVFGLLATNALATTLCMAAFSPIASRESPADEQHLNMVLLAGLLSLVASLSLATLAPRRRRDGTWWTLMTVVNLVQVGRLVPTAAAMTLWPGDAAAGGMLWGVIALPGFGLLAALGLVVTLRGLRQMRRRQLARTA